MDAYDPQDEKLIRHVLYRLVRPAHIELEDLQQECRLALLNEAAYRPWPENRALRYMNKRRVIWKAAIAMVNHEAIPAYELEEDAVDLREDRGSDVESYIHAKQLVDRLVECTKNTKSKLEAILEGVVQGKTFSEIGKQLGISHVAVTYAMNNLRAQFAPEIQDAGILLPSRYKVSHQ